jgi:hypothetical protein
VSYDHKEQGNGLLLPLSHPKKIAVRWVSDLRELDKVVRWQQYPLTIIQDILRKHTGYKFFTKIDTCCNITHLNWMNSLKIFVPFLHPLVNSSTTDCLWVLNDPLTLPKRLWKTYLGMLLKWRSI